MKQKTVLIFVSVFLFSFCVQSYLWLNHDYADKYLWMKDIEKVAAGEILSAEDLTYIHPGTTIVYPAAFFVNVGMFSPDMALSVLVALAISFALACVALLAYMLMPDTLWWVIAPLTLVSDARLLYSTPPSAIAAVLVVIIFLLVFYVVKEREGVSFHVAALLGAVFGLLLSTRIDTGVLVGLFVFPFVVLSSRKFLFVTPLAALLVFVATNPHLWGGVLQHATDIADQVVRNVTIKEGPFFTRFVDAYWVALVSLVLSLLVINRRALPFTQGSYVSLLLATLALTVFLAISPFHPLRYFYPLYIVWDVLLPLWIVLLSPWFIERIRISWLSPRRVEFLIIAFLLIKIPLTVFVLGLKDGVLQSLV